MPSSEPKVDTYAEGVEAFAKPILAHLRGLIRATCPEAVETLKWGIPHFDYRGEMMCIFAAYKSHCAFSFWKSALMSDPRLKASVDLPASKRFMGKLTSLADLPVDAELTAWIREAMLLNEVQQQQAQIQAILRENQDLQRRLASLEAALARR